MKLATQRNGRRDGALVIVSRDHRRAVSAQGIAPTLQAAIDDWDMLRPRLEQRFDALEQGRLADAFELSMPSLMAPLPRAYGWSDGSAYLNHMELARRLRGVAMPDGYLDDPRIYDGVSHTFIASGDALPCPDGNVGLDFEGEIGVILDDVAAGSSAAAVSSRILLLGLVNDTTLRTVFAEQAARGYSNLQGKPPCSMAPIVVTPDEAGNAWDGTRLSLPLECRVNDRVVGTPNTGADMAFDFTQMISRACAHRPFGAGSIFGAGTVSNRDPSTGCACLAEVRMIEQLKFGEPRTPYLQPGDRVHLEVMDAAGRSLFGPLQHVVERP